MSGENAEKAGLLEGDKIVGVNGSKISGSNFLPEKLSELKNSSVILKVQRDGRILELNTNVSDKGTIGISYETTSSISEDYKMKKYTTASAFAFGTADAW